MKKKLAALLLCAITLLCSCQTARTETGYETFPQVSHTCTGEAFSSFWNIIDPAENLPPINATRTVLFFGQDITLSYTETVCGGMYRSSENLNKYATLGDINTAKFRPSDGKLISFTQNAFRVDTKNSWISTLAASDEDLISYAKDAIAQFYDAEDYKLVSCDIDRKNNIGSIFFAKFVGDYKTSDNVTVTFCEYGISSVEFGDPGAFDGIESIDISQKKLDIGIKSFLSENLLKEDHELLSVTTTDSFLSKSTSGKTLLVSEITVRFRNKEDSKEGELDLSIGSYIE